MQPDPRAIRFEPFDPEKEGRARRAPIAAAAINGKHSPQREKPRILDLDTFLRLELPPRESLLDPILPAKGLAMLYGPRGFGKTHVALGIAYAVASGGAFFRWRAQSTKRVLYVDGEMPAATLQERLNGIIKGAGPEPMPQSLHLFTADLHPEPLPDLAEPDNQEWLESVWGEQPDLLILDNLSALTGAARDNDADAWTTMQRWLLSLRRRGVSVLFVHHAGKGGQQRGTSRREDILDTVIALRRPADYSPKEGARFEVHLEKARGLFGEGADPFEASLTIESGISRWAWKELEDARLIRAAALFGDDSSVTDVAEELGISKSAAGRLRKRAIAEGLFNGP
jgi:putative DNA primase/helicase